MITSSSSSSGDSLHKKTELAHLSHFLGRYLYPFILQLAHFLFGIYVRINYLVHKLSLSFHYLNHHHPYDSAAAHYHHHHRRQSHSQGNSSSSSSELSRGSSNYLPELLPKLPTHIAFSLLEDPLEDLLSLSSLADLITWSIEMNIRYISIYDINGCVKKRKDELRRELNSRDLNTSLQIRLNYGFEEEFEELEDEDPLKNAVVLSLLCHNDGKPDIVRTARHLAERVKAGDLSVEDIDEDLVGGSLEANRGLPDPDLLIRCGSLQSNMGFLPWQIRLTEIHNLFTHIDVSHYDFFQILLRFAKCEQRFGR